MQCPLQGNVTVAELIVIPTQRGILHTQNVLQRTSFSLHGQIIGDRIASVDIARVLADARAVQHAFCRRCLASVDVRHDAKGAKVLAHLLHTLVRGQYTMRRLSATVLVTQKRVELDTLQSLSTHIDDNDQAIVGEASSSQLSIPLQIFLTEFLCAVQELTARAAQFLSPNISISVIELTNSRGFILY